MHEEEKIQSIWISQSGAYQAASKRNRRLHLLANIDFFGLGRATKMAWACGTQTKTHRDIKRYFQALWCCLCRRACDGANSQQAHVGDWCTSQWEEVTFSLIRPPLLPTCSICWMCTPCGRSTGARGGVTSQHNAEDMHFLTLWCLINISLTFLWHFRQEQKK